MFYQRERGIEVYEGRPTEWTGRFALMYPSDYGFSTSGGNTTNRSNCLAKALYSWNSAEDCYTNSWLYDGPSEEWTLTPHAASSSNVFLVTHDNGGVSGGYYAAYAAAYRPALYLLSTIEIASGTGTSTDPFVLK